MVRLVLVLLVSGAVMLGLRALIAIDPTSDPLLAQIEWTFEPRISSAEAGRAHSVVLPDQWTGGRRALSTGRYVGTFQLPPASQGAMPWAAYFTSVGGEIELAVNGVRLIGEGALDASPSRYQPLLIRISPPIRPEGRDINQIIVDLRSDRVSGAFLGEVRIGPESLMATQYAQRRFVRHTLPLLIAMVIVLIGTISFILWNGRRHDRVYLWHALASYVISAHIVVALDDANLPAHFAAAIIAIFAPWSAHCCAMLGAHFYQIKPRPLLRVVTSLSLAVPVMLPVLAALLEPHIFLGVVMPMLWLAYLPVVGAIVFFIYWPGLRDRRDQSSMWMLVSAILISFGATQDGLMQFGQLAAHAGVVGPYTMVIPMVTFLGVLLQRFRNALADAETLNRELELRVAAREQQIAKSYRELQRVEQERAVSQERERMFRDMHDGLGGSLVAALARLSNEGASQSHAAHALRSALEDLRLMLASLDPEERSIRSALAVVRERIDNACSDAGIEFEFDASDLPEDLELLPTQLLQILRILQQASANALRHARARRLVVTCRLKNEVAGQPQSKAVIELLVDDDGIGFDSQISPQPGHHGLRNMRRRAQQLGADIQWMNLAPGTRVQLRIALDLATH